MKTFVDGVELRTGEFLSLIDVRSIERVEVITGPQASTIYGSGALNGVLNIITKKGNPEARERLRVHLSYGMIQNMFSSHFAPQHVDDVQLDLRRIAADFEVLALRIAADVNRQRPDRVEPQAIRARKLELQPRAHASKVPV